MNTEEPTELAPSEGYWSALLKQGELADGDESVDEERGGVTEERAPGDLVGDQVERRDSYWAVLEQWHLDGTSFEAPAIGCNKGGLLVRVQDNIAFLPASQLVDLPCTLGTERLRSDLEQMVGRGFRLRIIELDRSRNRVICSERAAHVMDVELEQRLDQLETRIGEEVEGVIRSLCDFGAFVDLGGIDGLVHVSELDWQRVGHPSELLVVGERVKLLVIHVDRGARRVALSRKRLHTDPWPLVAESYGVGDVIDATVTNVVPFGAFAAVAEGVEGLIHISELSDRSFGHPAEVIAEGQQVRVRVLNVDVDGRRLGLSLRQA